jgi:hypothetical protein
VSWITQLTRHRQHAGFDARDIDEITDQPIHPSAGSLDVLRMRHDAVNVILPRDVSRDHRGETDHAAQNVAQVVADDPKERIAGRERSVGTSAFA